MFLTQNLATQIGTVGFWPLGVDAARVPVIAAGSVADARGIVAALALGASGVQLGTAYLHCPESKITPLHRAALRAAQRRDGGDKPTHGTPGTRSRQPSDAQGRSD